MSHAKHVPIRLCVGCGVRAPQAALLRFTSQSDGALTSVTGASHGRSAYLHPLTTCWERFASRGGPLRSVRRSVDKPRRLAFVQELKAAEQSAMVR